MVQICSSCEEISPFPWRAVSYAMFQACLGSAACFPYHWCNPSLQDTHRIILSLRLSISWAFSWWWCWWCQMLRNLRPLWLKVSSRLCGRMLNQNSSTKMMLEVIKMYELEPKWDFRALPLVNREGNELRKRLIIHLNWIIIISVDCF